MSDSVRQTFLDKHNELRSKVARGLERDGAGGYAPKASKMLKMVYDCDIENSAMKNAQQCVFEHSDLDDLGENIFMTSVLKYDKHKAAEEAAESWWSELQEYGVGKSNKFTDRAQQAGHYTQMAWETSYKLGCAVQHCSDMTYVVCEYGPAGNWMDELIYSTGEPCSECKGKCSKDEGLCIVA
ncbi:SCP-like protein [Oesophagostomum dentatum]|uniref:SCP-like protein n=1 Tax=Oesophagostomum dentatum TaxID=61180 RepID=A0A0B1SAI9_OESDE|nr:SCP-like protein [Oesophagostomum dentatum]